VTQPFVRHGDAEALCIEIAKNHTPELASANFMVSTDLRGYDSGMRWIVLSQEGGSKAGWNVINKPRIDFEVRSESRNTSRDVAEILEASFFRAIGTKAWGCSLSQVKEETGILRIPDKLEDVSFRYIFSLRLVVMIDEASMPTLLS